tara:strand:- start:1262 stop:1912 length:651 start_codon:yes stop_codon:yes gene_type:complete
VKNQSYHFEVKDLITQFVAAFDDTIINRYDKDREIVDKIAVRYVYAPKQRVLHDIINKSQHISVPAVALSITSVARDENRVFNKIFGSYSTAANFIPAPVPIDIEIDMSIVTKFQTDMDQILSNFIPYNNPYIIISWKVPEQISPHVKEIRSEVMWSGSVSLDYPAEIEPTAAYRLTADTSFTIKGWLFPEKTETDGPRIFYVDTNITPVTGLGYI